MSVNSAISLSAYMPVCNLQKLAILNSDLKYHWISPKENCCTLASFQLPQDGLSPYLKGHDLNFLCYVYEASFWQFVKNPLTYLQTP